MRERARSALEQSGVDHAREREREREREEDDERDEEEPLAP
jgi:hypothetical protein